MVAVEEIALPLSYPRYRPRHLSPVWWLALLASLFLHLSFFISEGGERSNSEEALPNSVIQISMVQPEPMIQPMPKPKPRPTATSKEPAPALEPEEKLVEEVPEEIIEEAAQQELVEQQAEQKAVEEGVAESLRQRYLNTLLNHIEHHKYYPSVAKRRGIVGHVDVRFVLLGETEVRDIEIDNGPAMLRRATRETLHKAMPFPKIPEELNLPMDVVFQIRFLLQ